MCILVVSIIIAKDLSNAMFKFHFYNVVVLTEINIFRKRGVFGQPSLPSVFLGALYWQCAPMILFVFTTGLNAG